MSEYRLRPLRAVSPRTCDWGCCSDESTAERHTWRYGWLAVCAKHALPEVDGPAEEAS